MKPAYWNTVDGGFHGRCVNGRNLICPRKGFHKVPDECEEGKEFTVKSIRAWVECPECIERSAGLRDSVLAAQPQREARGADGLRKQLEDAILKAWQSAPEDSPMAHLQREAVVDAIMPIIERFTLAAPKPLGEELK